MDGFYFSTAVVNTYVFDRGSHLYSGNECDLRKIYKV